MERSEEYRLIKLAQAGDREAAGLLVDQHNRALWKIVRHTRVPWMHHDDLYQSAAILFLRCIQKFDTARGIRLSTFTYGYIGKRLYQWAYTKGLIHVPYYARKKKPRLANSAMYGIAALDCEKSSHVRVITAEDLWHKWLEGLEELTLVKLYMENLPDREWLVLTWRMEGWEFKDMAAVIGTSRQRVWQLYRAGIDRIVLRMRRDAERRLTRLRRVV
jgi:RNA polymerase sigma factor (sigma-70 family)